MASAILRDELLCSICLNLYTDPVTLRCGHNFCRDCIDQFLNTQDESGVYNCPECRIIFLERPELQRNITLCNVAERFLTTQTNQEEITRIYCTYCIHSPVPAVKSCLLCEVSVCNNHLGVHLETAPEHVLTEPSTSLKNRKCSIHRKILEYYCTEDDVCICVSCSLAGEHRGHRVEMLVEASEQKKEKLRNVLQNLNTKRKKTEERVQSLEEQRRKAQEKASRETKRVTAMFRDIRRQLDDLEKRVLSDISRREEKMILSLFDVIQNLEIEKDELSRKMRHIEELCNMTDPLTVLQESDTGDLCDPVKEQGVEDTEGHDEVDEGTGHDGGDEGTGHDGGDEGTGGLDGGDEDTGGHDGGDRGAELISHISHTLSDIIRDINVTFYGEGPANILLDVNSANNNLLISDNLKIATLTKIMQNRPETAERFKDYPQVISSRRFTSGRHYWDVKICGSVLWKVGMCYPSLERKKNPSIIGYNKISWSLYGRQGYNNQCSVIHDSKEIRLPVQITSNRVRICLDYEAGQLSFYELCDPIRHLHTFTATFTEPLHAALFVGGASIKISRGAAVRNRHNSRNLPSDW
ncbi:E3 ubiquitin/ISG15 ligase TRIM25-like [Ranitomeya imitator]|uniref:E3 ubiquitin/ISG15 ligase TRIM25-like n=1 Tax=Ranitomeya imitator TaxID=111125 RepID=UPI0037E9B928